MEEALKTLRHVHEIVSIGNFDYGGHRKAAQDSIKAAEHQLRWALDHDTYEERAKAARDLHAAHRDLERCLAYSGNRYGFGNGKPGRQARDAPAANRQLANAMPVIENTHHLLMAVDHEIKDYEHEKRELLKKRDEIKRKVHEEFHARIHNLSKEIAQEEHQVKNSCAERRGQENAQATVRESDQGAGAADQGAGEEEVTLWNPHLAQDTGNGGILGSRSCFRPRK